MGDTTPAAATGAADQGGEPGESRQARVNRELIELLNELRVALPGVQFLFAFLLVVPFQQRVAQATDFQRALYWLTLLSVAVATGLLIAPAAQHRVLFRKRDKEALLRRSSRYAYAGLLALSVAIVCAVLLVLDVLFGGPLAWITAVGVAALLIWLWIAVPFWHRLRSDANERGVSSVSPGP